MALPFTAGLAAAAFLFPSWRRSSYTKDEDREYYDELDVAIKPRSGAVFGIAWFILYILLSISIGVWLAKSNDAVLESSIYTTTYIFVLINFVANKLWDVLFFEYRNKIGAAVDAAILWITAIVVIALWARTDASYTVPIVLWSIYLVWLTYALVLSVWIVAKGTPKKTWGDPDYAQAVMNGEK
jgi:tryptophan-rich sensory protein